jgi:hypothetical protein
MWSRNRKLSKLGTGTVRNSYGSTTLAVLGARLSHGHNQQFQYALQSLTLWREIQTDMFKLWCLAEEVSTRLPLIIIFFFSAGFFRIFKHFIQHCVICRPSDSTVPVNAGIEPRTVATTALTVRRFNHSAKSHPLLSHY